MSALDRVVDRAGTSSVKWDGRAEKFGEAGVLPLWIADMDLASPPCVVEALERRVRHPIYGYTQAARGLGEALSGWQARRHGVEVRADGILWTPGALVGLGAALGAATEAGDGVVVMPPVYPGFYAVIRAEGRRVVEAPLREVDGRWRVDEAALGEAARGARALVLCNPHNPMGRAWEAWELEEVLGVARRAGLVVVSDEVHGDLALPGAEHVALARVAGAGDRVITLTSPGKTFNLQGLGLTAAFTRDEVMRSAMRRELERRMVHGVNPLSAAAAEAAWREGDEWVEALKGYLGARRDEVVAAVAGFGPALRVTRPEAGYLAWVDARGIGEGEAAEAFFVGRCGLGLNPGRDYGSGGAGWMRLNFGVREAVLSEALARIEAGLRGWAHT